MYPPQIIHVTSVDELRAVRPAWDDLWWRSDLTMPSVRAELLALWVEQFAPQARFHAIVVEDQGQWVAALPLVGSRIGRIVRAGGMPSNAWCPSGELLLDTAADVDLVLDVLVAAMRRLPWRLLWLEEVVLDAPRWHALERALDRAGVPTHRQARFQVGLLEIEHDWEAYQKRWSASHRRKMARSDRRLADLGDVELRMLSHLAPSEVEPWMRRGFEVEDRSWKGQAGTSVLRSPAVFDFFLRQAELLAAYDQLELALLESDGRPIAFEYCWNAKGVCHMIKTGYDPDYAACAPGQLLRHHALKRMHGEPDRRAYDFMGPMTDAFSRWRPSTYTVARAAIAPRRIGRTLLAAYTHAWPLVRRLRSEKTPCAEPGDGRGHQAPAPADEAPAAPEVALASPDSMVDLGCDRTIQGETAAE